ncbi:MAG: VWA domain-containing protein [Myxococcota bacterium]
MTRRLIPLFLLLSLPALAQPKTGEKPRVEMVFALDTTGSMGGLIEGAKRKIWSIVNEVAQGKPTPDVRIGLVAYRDRGDAYVTRVTQLSGDLDAVYAKLMALRADGGGDHPENVNQALSDAVKKIEWSSPQTRALRVVFLVGDAPPHMDYQDVPSYEQTVSEAAKRGIVVNAIRCGNDASAGTHWTRIARLGGGDFLSIDQSGGMVAVATPFDDDLARLSGELDKTYVVAGRREERTRAEESLAKAAEMVASGGGVASATRAAYRSKTMAAPAPAASADLVGAFEKDSAEAEKKLADKESLPEPMQAMSLEERKAYVQKKSEERKAIQAKIDALGKQRAEYLKKQVAAKDSFDEKVVEVVRKQATAKAGIAY